MSAVDAPLAAALDVLAARRPLLVALDFDGVLAPLVDDPSASRTLPAARPSLDAFAAADGVTLALVSGRDLATLARLAAPPVGTLLVGSHGAESGEVLADGVAVAPLDLTDAQRAARAALITGLEAATEGRRGVWIETKPTAAVLHTRLAGRQDAEAAERDADAVALELGLRAMHGKDVVEVAVVETSKGRAIELLRERLGSSGVLYAGDDTTDEHAFEVLGPDDVSLKVGPGATLAAYRVADPDAVAAVLERLTGALGRPR